MLRAIYVLTFICSALVPAGDAISQQASVNPGINDSFRDPDVQEFIGRFEVESREIFVHRRQIVKACQIKSGQTVADIGAGTGLFTRLFSAAVGPNGRVIAVDISQKFLDHIATTSQNAGQRNVNTLLATDDSTGLPPNSVDVAFICDTYHHFEFPLKTMASIRRALKPDGRVIVVDFHRIPGKSSDWIMNHVRAGQDVFEAEIIQSGFTKIDEEPKLLDENYFVVFQKSAEETSQAEGPPWGRGRGRSWGPARRRGPRDDVRADQAVFHFLLANHDAIRRDVTRLENGVETLTESDRPDVTRKIQQHAAAMQKRVEEGRGFRYWDDLFSAIFRRHASISMIIKNTEKGVSVRETSDDSAIVVLIQAHADVVSQFVERGFDEAHRNHPVPTGTL